MNQLIPPLRFSLLSLSFRDLSSDNRTNVQDEASSSTPLPRLYSSSHPLPRHLPFLARLQLKTIVALTPKDPLKQVPAMEQWAQRQDIQVKWIKVGAWKDVGTAAISNQVAEETISVSETASQPANLPTEQTPSTHGPLPRSQTLIATSSQPALLVTLTPQPASMILALLRLVQGYSLPSIQAELHRSLRTGLEGDADEDDVKDCESWLRGWIGRECSLSLRRSQVQEWVWPDGLLLSGLREQQPADGKTSPDPATAHHFHPTRHGSLNIAPKHAHANTPAAHRSATMAYPPHTPSPPSKPRTVHPFLKLSFLPEMDADQDTLQQSGVTTIAPPPPSASAPPTTTTTTTTTPQQPQPTQPAPIRMGRKRSQTISEGRGDALSHFMADSAAAAAIQSCGIDIGGRSGGPHASLSLNVDPANFLSISKSVPTTAGGFVNTPTTPTFSSSDRRPFLPDPQTAYPTTTQQQQQLDEGTSDADDDTGDQSTPKAHMRASYMSTAMRSGDAATSSSSGSMYRPPSMAVAAAVSAQELQSESERSAPTPAANTLGSDRLSPHLSPPMSPPDGDETPTKAKLQAQSQLRAEKQRQQQEQEQQHRAPIEYGEDDDQSVTVTAGDDTFHHVRPRGRSRGDSSVTLRVPPLVSDTQRDRSPAADSPVSGSPELDSEAQQTVPESHADEEGDEEEEGAEEEEEDEEGHEEDFSARLEALDLA